MDTPQDLYCWGQGISALYRLSLGEKFVNLNGLFTTMQGVHVFIFYRIYCKYIDVELITLKMVNLKNWTFLDTFSRFM